MSKGGGGDIPFADVFASPTICNAVQKTAQDFVLPSPYNIKQVYFIIL
jgi:hypothetical protein